MNRKEQEIEAGRRLVVTLREKEAKDGDLYAELLEEAEENLFLALRIEDDPEYMEEEAEEVRRERLRIEEALREQTFPKVTASAAAIETERTSNMNENRVKRNDLLAEKLIKNLEKRNMTGYYAKTKEEALEIALSLIPEGASVARGGSMSVIEIGLADALEKGNYNYCNRDAMPREKKREAELFAYDADVFLGSANAVSQDGVLVNIDGNANRVSAIAYGPRKVVLIVGMNKITGDVDSAMKRARNEAATINAERFGLDTPCCKTGTCMNCLSPDTICCQFLFTRYSKHAGRIHVILVNDNLGF